MEKENQSLSTELVYQLLSDYLLEPTVFKNMIDQWSCRYWTIYDWGKRLKNKKIRFRIGENKPNKTDPLWESDCSFIESNIEDFNDWLQTWPNCSSENVFNKLNPEKYWCYADYKYMAQLFQEDSNMLESVDWSVFGFGGRNGKESTIWIGSAGAHTPCHYDTYGYNLVAQLFGKKRWILFPPTQTPHLQPTRIPYEESSVFSKVNIRNPQLNLYPGFKNTTPYIVCLNPGDVLFVPRHWWHYVETIEPAVSINTWIEMDEDNDSRLQEAISRLIVTSIAPVMNQPEWLNPTEELTSVEDNLHFITTSLRRLLSKQKDCSSPISKRARPSKNDETKNILSQIMKQHEDRIIRVEPMEFENYLSITKYEQNTNDLMKNEIEDSNFSNTLLNCLVNPNVVTVVCSLLKKEFGIENYGTTK